MKANEFLQIFELGKTFRDIDKPKRKKYRRERLLDFSDIDVALLLQKKLQEAETLKKLLDDREKANKKEDKKKDDININRLTQLMVLTAPITGPIYWLYFLKPLMQ